jgi:hypothetical protein
MSQKENVLRLSKDALQDNLKEIFSNHFLFVYIISK